MRNHPVFTGANYKNTINRLLLLIYFCTTLCFASGLSQPVVDAFQLPPATQDFHYTTQGFQLATEYSDQFGVIALSKLTRKLNDNNAFALELDYGKNENREGLTWGTLLTEHQFFKLTGERLEQRLPFIFYMGPVQERVPQYACGAAYKYIFPKKTFSNFGAGVYRATAENLSLTPISFVSEGNEYTDNRRIAGATSEGAHLGFDLTPSDRTLFQTELNYDRVHYNTLYPANADTAKNQQGFGATFNLHQLILDKGKISLNASQRKIYDDYSVELTCFPQTTLQPEVSLAAERIVFHNDSPTENKLRLMFKFNLDGKYEQRSLQTLPVENNSLTTWTNEPAVHMERVLATSDELIRRVELSVTSLMPDNGNDSTLVTFTGQGFTSSTSITFGGIAAASITYISSTTLQVRPPVHAYGAVDVVVSNPGNNSTTLTNGFTYHGSLLEESTPNVGSTSGGTSVSLYGDELTGASSVTFGGVAATNVVVVDDHTVTCTTPAHAAGAVDIAITTPLNTSTLMNGFTYYATPTPSGVSPDVGTTGGSTSVTISGSNFTGATSVTFGGTAATSVSVVNDTTITCVTPAHAAGAVNVVVTNPVTNGTLSNGFTYYSTPAPSGVTPNVGATAGSTSVTLSGSGFTGATGVTFGGTAATSVSVVNDTTITCVTPAHAAGAVNVVVTNPATNGTLTNGFTYYATPAPSSVSPDVGTTGGSTSVTISGSNFTGATGVAFGGTTATSVTVVNDTTITCVTPAHAAGAVNVVVTNPVTNGTLTNGFTYYSTPAPSSVSPDVGSTGGSTSVTISGSNFTGATSVTFGGTAATSVSVVNDTTITCVTPSHAAGAVNVVVTNPATNGTLNNGFTYYGTPAPSSVNPSSGATTGSTSVTISGSGFTGATGVTFGGSAATSVSVVNDTTITCITPAHAAGAVDVVVSNPIANGTLTNGYTYFVTPAPSSVNPDNGTTAGGTLVTITGTNFTGATGVTFGGVAATLPIVLNDTTMTCITPAHAAGAVNVVVSNASTSGTLTNGFTYYATPAPASVNPNVGTTSGGASVTISGSGFTGATDVTFGGTAATSVIVVNDTTITCTTPAHAAGAVSVVVTNPATNGTLNNGFTYYATPAPTSVNANNATTAGGTLVTINGSGFTGATSVTFGGTAATNVLVVTDGIITCTTPAHAAGVVDVVITNPATSGTLTNGFTYYATPAPTSVSPNQGMIAGGTSVTVSGSNFTGATGVTFGGIAATSVVVVNATTITCVTPAQLLPGAVNVVVSNPATSGTLTNGFTYYATPAPISVVPALGSTSGGTSVSIAGTGFTGATGVTFGGTAATNVVVVTDILITCTTPAHAAGSVNVVVSNPLANGTLNNGFLYLL